MAYDDNNIFAKILRNEAPCHKVYEDEQALAFLDVMPRTKGHTLVIPKVKAMNIFDISAPDLAMLMTSVHKLAPIVRDAMEADGLIIQQFNEAAAGQMVFHIHFHLLPRFEGVPMRHAHGQMEREEILLKNAEKIRAAFS